MKFSLFSILSALVLFAIPCSAAGEEPVAVSAQAVHINWYEIPPDIRRYLILMTAVSMELNAELPDGGINPTPQQQFDMMQKMMKQMGGKGGKKRIPKHLLKGLGGGFDGFPM